MDDSLLFQTNIKVLCFFRTLAVGRISQMTVEEVILQLLTQPHCHASKWSIGVPFPFNKLSKSQKKWKVRGQKGSSGRDFLIARCVNGNFPSSPLSLPLSLQPPYLPFPNTFIFWYVISCIYFSGNWPGGIPSLLLSTCHFFVDPHFLSTRGIPFPFPSFLFQNFLFYIQITFDFLIFIFWNLPLLWKKSSSLSFVLAFSTENSLYLYFPKQKSKFTPFLFLASLFLNATMRIKIVRVRDKGLAFI